MKILPALLVLGFGMNAFGAVVDVIDARTLDEIPVGSVIELKTPIAVLANEISIELGFSSGERCNFLPDETKGYDRVLEGPLQITEIKPESGHYEWAGVVGSYWKKLTFILSDLQGNKIPGSITCTDESVFYVKDLLATSKYLRTIRIPPPQKF